MPRTSHLRWMGPALLFLLTGCNTPTFDPAAYQTAVQLKYETLALIDKSGQKYSAHQAEAEILMSKYQAAEAVAARTETNKPLAEAWKIISAPNTGSAGEYFATWKQRGTMRPAIRAEKKIQIGRQFDYVVCLEAAKQTGPLEATRQSTAECTNPLASAPAMPAAAGQGGQQ